MKYKSRKFKKLLIITLIFIFTVQPIFALEKTDIIDKKSELIVRFDEDASKNLTVMNSINDKIGAKIKKKFKIVKGMNLVEIDKGVSIDEAISYYNKNPNVLYVEPNYEFQMLNTDTETKNEEIKKNELYNELYEEPYREDKNKLLNENVVKKDINIEDIDIDELKIVLKEEMRRYYESESNNNYAYADYVNSNYYGNPPYAIFGDITYNNYDLDLFKFNIVKSGTIDLYSYWIGNYAEVGYEDYLYMALIDENQNVVEYASHYGYGAEEYINISSEIDPGIYYVAIYANKDYGDYFVGEPYVVEEYFKPELEYNFNYLWGLENNGQQIFDTYGTPGADIDVEDAWTIEEGNDEIIIAVVDSGVDYYHPYLKNNMWKSSEGYYGKDFINNDNFPMDNAGHGTHVAGTIAGYNEQLGNSTGVMKDASIMALKVFNDEGTYTSTIVEAIEYANNNGADVINLSLGGSNYSSALKDVIQSSDAVVVASAGNEGVNNDYTPSYPASYNLPNMITVAASDNKDYLADFSNYGKESVDLAAPGKYIFSTMYGDRYAFMNGTSMAAPHVSGIAGLVLSRESSLSNEEVVSIIKESVDKKINLTSYVETGGRANAQSALIKIEDYLNLENILNVVVSIGIENIVISLDDYEKAYQQGEGNQIYDYLAENGGIDISGFSSGDKYMNIQSYAKSYALYGEDMAVENTEALSVEEIQDFKVLNGFDENGNPILESIK